jgi:hypothetical protein
METGTFDININAYDVEGERTGYDIFVEAYDTEEEAINAAKEIRSIADLEGIAEDLELFHPEDGEYLQVEVNYVRELDDDENECGENWEYGPTLYEYKLAN